MSELQNSTWTAVDTYTTSVLHPHTSPTIPHASALSHAQESSTAASLPSISVSAPQGSFLRLLARSIRAAHVLEIGTLGGYSTIWLAGATDSTKVTSIELDAEHVDVARGNVEFAGLQDRVKIIHGAAADVLLDLKKEVDGGTRPVFDFVFIDADKQGSWGYVQAVLGIVRAGAIIVVDNVVRDGKVADLGNEDERVVGSRKVIEGVGKDGRLEGAVLQTVGEKGYDGFLVAVVN